MRQPRVAWCLALTVLVGCDVRRDVELVNETGVPIADVTVSVVAPDNFVARLGSIDAGGAKTLWVYETYDTGTVRRVAPLFTDFTDLDAQGQRWVSEVANVRARDHRPAASGPVVPGAPASARRRKVMGTGRSLAVLALVGFSIGCFGRRPPSDSELRATFLREEGSIRALERAASGRTTPTRRQVAHRGRTRLEPEAGTAEAAMRDLGAKTVVTNPPGELCEVEIDMHRWGLSIGGWRKGFCLARTPPQPLVGSLDHFWSDPKSSGMAFARLQGRWFLFVQVY